MVILREADDPLQLAHKIRHVGDLHRHCGRWDDADTCYEEAAALYRRHDRPGGLDYPNAIRPMAILKERLGDRQRALALWREARALYAAVDIEGIDSQPALDECDRHVARLGSNR